MKKEFIKKIETLQPGFLVVYLSGLSDYTKLNISVAEWESMKTRGFYGGLVITGGITLASLDDSSLEAIGLKRITKVKKVLQ